MKLIQVSLQMQYADALSRIVEDLEVANYIRYPRVEGKDVEDRHENSKAFPGNMTVLQAYVPDEQVEKVLDTLREFREEKQAHEHLVAVVLSVEQQLGLGDSSAKEEE